jgi:RNA polymerase sigma factor (sigma-70 family)
MGDPASVTDAQLLAVATDDVSAFEELYRRHVCRVTAFATRRCASAEDVADVVAQTFLRLLRVADRYDPGRGDPSAFVLAIAANIVRDQHRGIRRQRALVSRLSGRDLLDADDTGRIEAAIDAARTGRAVRAALEGVPDGEGQVLRLVAGGASPSEAAATLGITPGAARVRLARARHRIRTKLAVRNEEQAQ